VSSAEVKEQALRVFGDSVAGDDGATTDDEVSDVGEEEVETTWDIDVRSYETHARVEHFVRLFSGPARERIEARLSRGSRYLPLIRTKFREAGLPEDMSYLALVESGYHVDAYSRAAAVGMWQFMTSTARGFGMRVDWWVDERRDPMKSTDGAIRFLKALNEQFGSLYIAAAAYNGGPGRLARGLNRFADDLEGATGDDRFFALAEKKYLPRETKDYVPQLIAAALVGKEPERYGLRVDSQPLFVYDSVRVGPATPLAAIAKSTASTTDELVQLNPHILRGATPPRDSFTVRVPVGRIAGFDSAFAALTKEELTPWSRVVSKKGDTPASVARTAGITSKQLGWYNPKLQVVKKTGRLVVGQTILVPTVAVAAAARDVPDPAIERYGSSRGSIRVHVVRKGENLGSIARRYKTTVAQLQRRNGLKKSIIYPGQELIVSGGSVRSTSRSAAGRTRSGVPTTAASGSAYVVKAGDTLSEIAEEYGTSVRALKERNGLRSSNVRIGQKLIIP
jgi:membrane-bound lytic murein transglycosylase D